MRWGAEDYSDWEAKRRLWRQRQRVLKKLGIAAALLVLFLAAFWTAWNYLPQSMDLKPVQNRLVYFPNCAAARAAGAAPIRIGQPGYRPELDADNDGKLVSKAEQTA